MNKKDEIQKKPIVIAGNGPSLAQIDYRRLPADFDVFRCNQFYFEDKYFLGRRVTGAFLNPNVAQQQYFNFKMLQESKDYIIDQKYLVSTIPDPESELNFPGAKNIFYLLETMPQFHELQKFLAFYYQKYFTSSIYMLITALALGYREIYLVGLDFYQGGGVNYAFDTEKPRLLELMPNMKKQNFQDPRHGKDIDLMGLNLAKQMPDVHLYCISETGCLKDYLPLADVRNQNPMTPEDKDPDAIKDFLPLPPRYTGGKVTNLFQFLGLLHEYEALKQTFLGQVIRDLWVIAQSVMKILIGLLRRLLRIR